MDIGCWVQHLTPFWNTLGTSRSLKDFRCLILEEEHGLNGDFSSGKIKSVLKIDSWPCYKVVYSILWIGFLIEWIQNR